MKKRILGKNLEVSAIGLGLMGMDHAYGKPADRTEMIRLIQESVELGGNFFDTAVVYGEENEKVLGQATKEIRNQVVIATKFGITGQQRIGNSLENIVDSRPESIRLQVEGSLRRLQTDYIDLYYQHRIDPNVAPEDVAETMNQLIKEGKILHWGLSNAPENYVRKAHAVSPITAIENQYSMIWREPEAEMFKICDELGIGFVAYSPLGNGFLSGKYAKETKYEEGDFRSFMGRFKPEVMEKNQVVLDLLTDIAASKRATSAQIVLAWELAQRDFIVPIPGTTKVHRLKENLGAMNILITNEERLQINQALAEMTIDETHF
ncbi:aldo/keto reductase [Enterococcus plantarum]|uniref:aldo/keto reductase n=1 Tax=Enterococcus plantarum TaxID=1077675 RepID=UPI001A8F2D2C|nr:aldo/keto reductase [Enterococcus plantarum]MBO0422793.1 aldo/keto reductase [Enterococcus plantarum]